MLEVESRNEILTIKQRTSSWVEVCRQAGSSLPAGFENADFDSRTSLAMWSGSACSLVLFFLPCAG